MGGDFQYKDFNDLDIWKDAYDFLMRIYKISYNFPSEEKFSLTSQIRRSANSVVANIAESHGRFNFADKVRVLYISRGEVAETRSHVAVAYGLGYISKKEFEYFNKDYKRLAKKINLYINSLNKK